MLTPFLPFIALLLILSLAKFPKLEVLSDKISALFSILFLVSVFALKNFITAPSLTILTLPRNFSFALSFANYQFIFLLLLGLFWLFGVVYGSKYFLLEKDNKIKQFHILFLLIIGFLALIILSQNLLTALLFYQIITLVLCFIANKLGSKSSKKSAQYFGFFVLFGVSFLFFATVLTFKITGELNFVNGGIFSNLSIWKFSLLFVFFILAVSAIAFLPLYLIFGNLYYLAPPILLTLLIGFGFTTLVLLFKIIICLFGNKLFVLLLAKTGYTALISILLGLNLIVCAVLAILSKNLKQIITLLFFNQLILLNIAFLTFGLNARQMQLSIAFFVLSQLLIFISVGNINLYLRRSRDKTLNGIFYKLKVTIAGLIFSLLSIIGLIPSLGMLEKYWWIKRIIGNELLISGLFLSTNLLLCGICFLKVIYPMIEISKKNSDPNNYAIAREVESHLSLSAPILILTLLIFSLSFSIFSNIFIGK